MKTFTETTLPNLFLNRVYRFGSKPFLHYKSDGDWKQYTWAEIGDKVEKIGRGLLALGVKKGDKVCIMSENRPEWAVFDLAILSIGAVTVPIYYTSIKEQAIQIIDHSDASVVIISKNALMENIRIDLSQSKVRTWICLEKSTNCLTQEAILERSKEVDGFTYYQILSQILPTDLATIVYTSGTTGDPKGVMLSHDNILSNTIASSKTISIHVSDTSLSFLPLSHMFERTAGFFCFIYFGATIYYAEDIHTIPQNLLETHPTILIAVPRILEKFYNAVFENIETKNSFVKKLFKHSLKTKNSLFLKIYSKLFFQKIKDKMGGRIRFIVSGGAALTPAIGRFFNQIGLPVLEGYGLTETSPVISFNSLDNNRPGTVGHVLSNLEVKLAEDKEILVKGPSVMMGYYKDPENTKDAFTADGFFKTGDIGEFQDGFLKITDRKKDLIVTSGGKKIAPQPIEGEFLHYPLVDQICLVGEGMKTIGALIVPSQSYLNKTDQPEVHEQFQKIVDEVNQHLSQYEQIKSFKLLSKPFSQENQELTPTLKLRRKNIFQHYQHDIETLFS